MIKVRAHTCYLGKTGYSAHARNFFRELSNHVDLRVRNYTWDNYTSYLNSTDFSILDQITLRNQDGNSSDYHISHSFPNLPWKNFDMDFNPDVDIVLMDMDHEYFYEEYNSKIKIAYTVWESTEIPKDFFDQLLKFDYLWVATEWHKKVVTEQGYPNHRVLVVNEGVSEEFFTEISEDSKIPDDFNDGRFKFLFFGRWDYRKSVPEIIDSFLKAFPNNEPVDLILSADNPYSVDGMNSTEERLSHYGFNDERIKIKHFVDRKDYVSYLKKGDVMITCARSEGWNIPLIEAMAAGTPVIYSNWGAQLEFAEGKGNPVKIEKELPASLGAKLGFATDAPGLYSEPDYDDLINVLKDCYENYDTKKKKALEESNEIRENYNWKKIGRDGYKELKKICPVDIDKATKEESVVILSHADTEEKLSILRRSIITLKNQGYFIILSSHIGVPSDVMNTIDYFICETDNPIVDHTEYSELSNTVPIHYINHPDFNLVYSFDYNHGYAALRLIINGAIVSKGLGYKITHFINYDYVIDDGSHLENHSSVLNDPLSPYSVFSYKWNEHKSINSAFFSGITDDILSSIYHIKSKKDYFKYDGVVILEDFIYRAFEDNGLNMYIGNIEDVRKNNILNSITVPTYPQIKLNNGGVSHIYLSYEESTSKHYLFISGSGEVLEGNIVRGSDITTFKSDAYGNSIYEIPNDDLINGISVILSKYNRILSYDTKTKKASIDIRNKSIVKNIQNEGDISKVYTIGFIDGPSVEIRNSGDSTFTVEFIDSDTGITHYKSLLSNNTWAKSGIKYFKNWLIKIQNNQSGEIFEERIDLKGKNVLINIESSSLGDSIAWFAHVEEFQKKHECNIFISTFKNNLFEKNYPEMVFVEPGQVVNDIYALYRIGWYYTDGDHINYETNPRDFRSIPMQATSTDILGLNHTPDRPRIVFNESERPIDEDYACIGIHSTAQAKYWNNPTGWQELTDWLNSQGIKVVMLSLEEDGYMGNPYPQGVITIDEERTLESTIKYLRHSKMFIGVGSGLSWLSWSLNVPTVIISGFSSPWTEPIDKKVLRIFNSNTCNSCFNRHRLDAGDWNWCPDKKGTPQQFECTKSITGENVIEKIKDFLLGDIDKSVDSVVDESYSLGMVQNRSEIVGAAKFYKDLKVKNFMEIGTDQGGTFAIWSKLSLDSNGKRISVDMPHGRYGVNTYNVEKRDNYLRSLGSDVTMIHGSSHEEGIKDKVKNILDGELLDFLFIDGDHTYEGVRKDYHMYREFVKDGGWIGFHDTKDTEYHRNANCRVDILWSELEGEKIDFVDETSNFGGIGFIQKTN